MITEALLGLVAGFVGWLFSFFPSDFEAPTWIADFSGMAAQVVASTEGMGVWVPGTLILAVAGVCFAYWGILLLVKLLRWLLGLVPTMGGG